MFWDTRQIVDGRYSGLSDGLLDLFGGGGEKKSKGPDYAAIAQADQAKGAPMLARVDGAVEELLDVAGSVADSAYAESAQAALFQAQRTARDVGAQVEELRESLFNPSQSNPTWTTLQKIQTFSKASISRLQREAGNIQSAVVGARRVEEDRNRALAARVEAERAAAARAEAERQERMLRADGVVTATLQKSQAFAESGNYVGALGIVQNSNAMAAAQIVGREGDLMEMASAIVAAQREAERREGASRAAQGACLTKGGLWDGKYCDLSTLQQQVRPAPTPQAEQDTFAAQVDRWKEMFGRQVSIMASMVPTVTIPMAPMASTVPVASVPISIDFNVLSKED